MGRLINLLRNLNYLSKHSLWDQREEDIVYLTNKIIDDVQYEYDIDGFKRKKLNILTREESLEEIFKCEKSFIRTGDGEIAVMQGKNHPFQDYNNEVAELMIDALKSPHENLLVGLKGGYFLPLAIRKNHKYYRRNAYDFREFYYDMCSGGIKYIDAACTTTDDSMTIDENILFLEKWKFFFKNKDLIIVCGEGILDGIKYDIFELANSKKFIYGPKTNAWDKKDEIIEEIRKNYNKGDILIFILGQAGKAMIVKLSQQGYLCFDVGHLAKLYNSLKLGTEIDENFYAPD